MSDNGRVQVEFGGQVAPSYDSSVDHVKKGLVETAREHAKATAEIIATEAAAYVAHEAKHRATTAFLRAAWTVIRSEGSNAFGTVISKVVEYGGAVSRLLPILSRVPGGLAMITGGVTILRGTMALLRAASDEVGTGLDKLSAKEDLVSKLKPLTGSVEAAKAKLKELAAFAKGTPLSLPEVVDTYRSTQVQTGGALSGKAGLTMIGDVAAASGNGLKETGDAVSQLYGDLQAGAPIDEATKKLQGMNIVSAETVQHIYALQAAGKSGAEIWTYLAGQLQKSSGAMQAAATDLSTLQKALLDAKNRLHELFAEASVNGTTGNGDSGLKKQIKSEITALEALQPAAEEAGQVYAQLRQTPGEALTFYQQLLGIWKSSAPVSDKVSASLLTQVGSLKNWVDVGNVGVAAATGLGATLVATGTAWSLFGAGAAAAALSVGFVGSVAAAAAAGLIVYTAHINTANKELHAIYESNDALIKGVRAKIAAMKTETDQVLALAAAYAALDEAQRQASEGDTKGKREEGRRAAQELKSFIRSAEGRSDLAPSEARAKTEKANKDAQDELDDLGKNPEQKYDAALSEMTEARKAQFAAREKLAKAIADAAPGGEASDTVIDPQVKAALQRINESKRRVDASSTLPEGFRADPNQEKAAQDADEQKIRELEGLRDGRQQRIVNARGDLTTQDAAVVEAAKGLASSQKANDEYQAKLRQLDVEKQIAALDTEGLERAREEWRLKREGLEKDLVALKNSGDADETKTKGVENQITQGNKTIAKQEEEAGFRRRELEDEQKIAALKSEGVQRASEEWAIRLATLQARLESATKHGDTEKQDEITTKVVQGNAKLTGTVDNAAIKSREVEAEAQIALLQSEGIQRAREESEIRLRTIEAQWNGAKDQAGKEAERLNYIREQAALKEKERQNAVAEGNDLRALNDEIGRGQDAAAKRELDRQYKAKQITDQQRREGEAALVERERLRLEADADAKNKDADEAEGRGDKDAALKLRREAEQLSAQAVEKGYQENELLIPERQRPVGVADSLARYGVAGNAIRGSNIPDLLARGSAAAGAGDSAANTARQQLLLTRETNTILRELRDKQARRPDDRPGRWGK